MRNLVLFLFVSLTAAGADEVGQLNVFSPGQPAKANDVNTNFSSLKSVINSNAQVLDRVASQKQNVVTGLCAKGSAVKEIKADGSVICESLSLKGSMSISPLDFHIENELFADECVMRRSGYLSTFGTSSHCRFFAPVALPDGVSVYSLSCAVTDDLDDEILENGGTGYVEAILGRSSIFGQTGNTHVKSTPNSEDLAPEIQTLNASTNGFDEEKVDNARYYYYLMARFHGSDTRSWTTINNSRTVPAIRLYGCSIGYR